MAENSAAIEELRRFWSHTSHLQIDQAIRRLARTVEEYPEDSVRCDADTLLIARALVRHPQSSPDRSALNCRRATT